MLTYSKNDHESLNLYISEPKFQTKPKSSLSENQTKRFTEKLGVHFRKTFTPALAVELLG